MRVDSILCTCACVKASHSNAVCIGERMCVRAYVRNTAIFILNLNQLSGDDGFEEVSEFFVVAVVDGGAA